MGLMLLGGDPPKAIFLNYLEQRADYKMDRDPPFLKRQLGLVQMSFGVMVLMKAWVTSYQ